MVQLKNNMVNWGIVGLGSMGNAFANAINEVKNAQLIGVASKSNSKLEVFSKNFKIKTENRFLNYDLVFCLNVLNWVKNKKKLLKFLGRFNELIFEGHDDYIIEKKRLKAIGFKKIKLISVTERNRPLIYCIKK